MTSNLNQELESFNQCICMNIPIYEKCLDNVAVQIKLKDKQISVTC